MPQEPEEQPGSPEPGIPETVSLPMTGELDLHTFRPRDARDVVREYLMECQRRGVRRIRVVHGKGIGQLREVVHAELRQHPLVESYRLAGSGMGGWGATLVQLKAPPSDVEPGSGKGLKDEARQAKNP